MKYNDKIRLRRDTGKLFFLAFTLILIIGGSYAWMTFSITSVKEQVIKAGSLNMVLDESTSNGITLTNTIPMSDARGLRTEEYTFTLENRSSLDTAYTIYLDDMALDTTKTRMPDKYIKYSITKNSGEATTRLLTEAGSNPNRILDTGTIDSNNTNSYTLRFWIDSNADNGVMGTVFLAKLRIEAIQASANE